MTAWVGLILGATESVLITFHRPTALGCLVVACWWRVVAYVG